ncbi:hypothetical protein [Mycobacterium sp. URHB0021]
MAFTIHLQYMSGDDHTQNGVHDYSDDATYRYTDSGQLIVKKGVEEPTIHYGTNDGDTSSQTMTMGLAARRARSAGAPQSSSDLVGRVA